MLSSKITPFVLGAAALLVAAAASGDDPIRLYSYDTLNTLWTDTVTGQALTSLTPDAVKSNLGSTPMSTPTPPTTGGSTGGWGPPSKRDAGAPIPPASTTYFQIMTVDAHMDAEIVSRRIALSTYLNKSDFFQPTSVAAILPNGGSPSDIQAAKNVSDEQGRVVRLRRYEANMELFLIGMIRYFTVSTVVEKCEEVTEVKAMLGQLDAGKIFANAVRTRPNNTLNLDPRFAALEPIATDVATRYRSEIKDSTACTVTPASSRLDALRTAAATLETDLNNDLQPAPSGAAAGGAVATTLTAINKKQGDFVSVQLSLANARPHTSELLALELAVSDSVANFQMVSGDKLGVQAQVAQMKNTVDVNKIVSVAGGAGVDGSITDDQLRNFDMLGTLKTDTAAMQATLTTFLTTLKSAASLDPTLGDCGAIDPAGFMTVPDPTLGVASITKCLNEIKAALDNAGQPSLTQQEMGVVEAQLKLLSPQIINDRSGH